MGIVVNLLVSSLAVFITAQILPGVHMNDFLTAIIVAVIMGVINSFVKPILVLLTLPITLVTFGLFVFVINALLVLLVSRIVPGFVVDSFWWALLFSLIVSIVSSFLNSLAKPKAV